MRRRKTLRARHYAAIALAGPFTAVAWLGMWLATESVAVATVSALAFSVWLLTRRPYRRFWTLALPRKQPSFSDYFQN